MDTRYTSPFPYNAVVAFVVPLQGLWNAVIFFVASWEALIASIKELRGGAKTVSGEGDMAKRTVARGGAESRF